MGSHVACRRTVDHHKLPGLTTSPQECVRPDWCFGGATVNARVVPVAAVTLIRTSNRNRSNKLYSNYLPVPNRDEQSRAGDEAVASKIRIGRGMVKDAFASTTRASKAFGWMLTTRAYH